MPVTTKRAAPGFASEDDVSSAIAASEAVAVVSALGASAAGQIVPRHVAIIMDGNGRWAQARGLPRIAGHRRGAEAVRRTLSAAADLGIPYLTLFGFSSENWKRPLAEVDDLMGLLRHYLRGEIAELHRNNVRLRVIGDRDRLAHDIVTLITNAEALTRDNSGVNLTIALSYGGRAEIIAAMRAMAEKAVNGALRPEAIDEAAVSRHLFTADIPDPDLLIRTSGEQRISNFLLWQCAYSELVFTKTLWPDFGREDLEEAIADYGCRERRYGASIGSR
jgi:undecaprenyl diphosphate synthase